MLSAVIAGVISDTHGFVDPRAIAALAGVDLILHAGDVGSLEVLTALREIAPVHAVQGNNDAKIGGLGLPEHLDLEFEGVEVHLVHQMTDARPGPHTRVVVFGHSHKTLVEQRADVLYLNPGAAGRTGFHRVQTVALLEINGGRVLARIVELGTRLPAASAQIP
jgi:putative phosphoesterase